MKLISIFLLIFFLSSCYSPNYRTLRNEYITSLAYFRYKLREEGKIEYNDSIYKYTILLNNLK